MSKILSCDWGTSSFRLRVIDNQTAHIIEETTDGLGIAAIHAKWIESNLPETEKIDFYLSFLYESITQLTENERFSLPVLISGMASSSIGIVEVPYTKTPFLLSEISLNYQRVKHKITKQQIYIFSGICSENDIIRGEETLLIGSDFSDKEKTLVILPGTHSKHIFVENKEIVSIKTYMTGEFFELLSKKSILAATVETPTFFDEKAFRKGVKDSKNGCLLHQAFQVRTQTLLNGVSPESNHHYLSGLLIGVELLAIQKEKSAIIQLICGEHLKEMYRIALEMLDLQCVTFQAADAALVRGHCRLLKQITSFS